MALLSFDDELERAVEKRPFANGFEGEAWMAGWCGRCTHSQDEQGCTLTDVAMVGSTPAPWLPWHPGALGEQFICGEFTTAKRKAHH